MGRKWIILLLPLLWQCSDKNPGILQGLLGLQTPPPGQFRILRPDSNSVWRQGNQEDIRWLGNENYLKVDITLYRNQRWFLPIAIGTPNDGSFRWSIPIGLPNATDYRIVITAVEDSTVSSASRSTFTIFRQDQQFRVYAPGDGSLLHRGQTTAILWLGGNEGLTVRIELYYQGAVVDTLAQGALNTGRYVWNVPQGLSEGNKYRLHLVCLETEEQDFSDGYFTIE